jgi:antitoxin CcdA
MPVSPRVKNASKAGSPAERKLEQAVSSPRRTYSAEEIRRWSGENAEVIRSYNEYIEKHGLPLRKYRTF